MNELLMENKSLKDRMKMMEIKLSDLVKYEFEIKLRKLLKKLIGYILDTYYDDYMGYNEIKKKLYFRRSPKYINELKDKIDEDRKYINQLLFQREEDKRKIDDLIFNKIKNEYYMNELLMENKSLKDRMKMMEIKLSDLVKYEFEIKLRKLLKKLIGYILDTYYDDYMGYNEIKKSIFSSIS
jgi:hypothetical protein